MFLPRKTKNSSWEVLTKNLVTFKRWDEVKDKKYVMLCRFRPPPETLIITMNLAITLILIY